MSEKRRCRMNNKRITRRPSGSHEHHLRSWNLTPGFQSPLPCPDDSGNLIPAVEDGIYKAHGRRRYQNPYASLDLGPNMRGHGIGGGVFFGAF
jgi:hypothetical protein